jgi:tripartite-type tricarboxylate transporter receptor subunit TctC
MVGKMEPGKFVFLIVSLVLIQTFLFEEVSRAEFPERPITVLVSFDPGSTVDLITRATGSGAQEYLGKPFIFENRPGAGGTVALSMVAIAKPDGYTLCAAPNASVVDTPLIQKVPFKPLKNLTPIIGLSAAQHTALLVKNDAPWKTFQEFMDYAKKNPGKIKYSTSGVGTAMHVAMEYIAQKAGIKWVHVPYKGSPAARTALLGGHVDACCSSIDWPPFVLSGQLRALATHGPQRSPHFPDVPTLRESGYDFINDTIHSVFGPGGLPPEITEKLENAFKKGMETNEFKTVREKLYMSPISIGSKEYEARLKETWIKEEKLLKEVGVIKEAATQPY